MPVRERSQGEPTPGQHVPFSGHVQAHTPGERRAFAPAATEDPGERDSPLEEGGFEPSVPRAKESAFLAEGNSMRESVHLGATRDRKPRRYLRVRGGRRIVNT